MESLLQDVRYGVRGLRRSVGYSVVATLTMALAIGVNTAIFSLVSLIAFADLPIHDMDRTAVVGMTSAAAGIEEAPVSYPEYRELVDRVAAFDAVGALGTGRVFLTESDEPLSLSANVSSANLFQLLGGVALGQGFREGDDEVGAPDVALLSHSFWEERYGSSSEVLGSTIRLDGREHVILGVATEQMEFADLAGGAVWLPLRRDLNGSRLERDLLVLGHLAPGVTFDQAREEVGAVSTDLADRYPEENGSFRLVSAPAAESLLSSETETILTMLILAVGFVLLLACSNVANISLARASGRTRELAVRAALGAGRVRLFRQMLTESLVVGLVAGVLGVAVASGLIGSLVRVTRGRQVLFNMVEIDTPVLLFTTVVSLLAVLGFGLVPALKASRSHAAETLKDAGVRSGGGRKGRRLRNGLVVAQVGFALTLMIVAAVFARSVAFLYSQGSEFTSEGLLSMVVEVPVAERGDDESLRLAHQSVVDAVRALPGVVSAGATGSRPNVFEERDGRPVIVESHALAADEELPWAVLTAAQPGYLETLEVPLIRGRFFDAGDGAESLPVALVSQSMANAFWPGGDPVGERLRLGGDEPDRWLTVVGVVGNVESGAATDLSGPPHVYTSLDQSPVSRFGLFARTTGQPEALAATVRQAIRDVHEGFAVDDVRSMEELIWDRRSSGIAITGLFAAFALFALLMAAAGIYGVMSYMVSERRSEISIRMALGAARQDVLNMVLRQGGRMLLIGGALGLLGAFVVSQLMSSVVWGISPRDPVTFVSVTVALGLVALCANIIPALRATGIQPMAVMREE